MEFQLFETTDRPIGHQPVEYVERKGLGHPDSICDAVMEAAAEALRQEYQARCGRILHHNLDKALLVAGQSEPTFGGGRIIHPIKIFAGDRATNRFGDTVIPVDEIVEARIRKWFADHLRFATPEHLNFQSEIQPGAVELADIFSREIPVANDTSAGVGFAPLSETEQMILATEHYINSADFKERFPVAGEDVKIMGVRHQDRLRLTIAVAMVDRFIANVSDYVDQKMAIRDDVHKFIRSRLQSLQEVSVDVNTLDDPDRGREGMYLTVIGTSAENGDGGEVGRGNAVNGLISLCRPTSNEAAAGKNNTCHVGNIYNHASHAIAAQIVRDVDAVQECYVWLCSQIGRPVNDPLSVSVRVGLQSGAAQSDVADAVQSIIDQRIKSL